MLFVPIALLLAVLFQPALCAAQVGGVVYIDARDLKASVESGERIALLDVRSSGAYDHSDIKIKGAIRIAPDELVDRAWELPMGKVIATYCT
jgi:rhodanese-related sulfurtransferase